MSTRMRPADRRAEILDAALRAARAHGFVRMTRENIADIAQCTPGLVSIRFNGMGRLRDEVMREAVRREVLEVVAEGLAVRNRYALKASTDLQRRALAALAPAGK